ncbi:flagellar brake protein [Peribacillus kribbensis]|uniref:flagellar brake protein n=1 Tax=Peribacillus kribbensis TaxID=356658 RepID=UPI00040C5D70|nr:flagellar brake domain-containing protein [Peribacillus kribbensis]
MMNIGDTITFEPKHTHKPEKYQAMVVESRDSSFYIDYPVNLKTRKPVFLLDGSQMKGSFVGQDNNVYLFDTQVLGRKMAKIPMIELQSPTEEELIKIQRRQFVRVETAVDAAVHPIDASFSPFSAVTLDLSAGGACVALPRGTRLNPLTRSKIWLSLPMNSGETIYLCAKSEIIRIDENRGGIQKASIKFEGLDHNERQHLIRFCFERQLGMKKKGL